METVFISLISNSHYLYWVTEIGCHFMRLNLDSNNVEYLHPECTFNFENVEHCAVLCSFENKIVYVLNSGKYIFIYNIYTNVGKIYEIECQNMHLNMYSYAAVIDNEIVIVPMYDSCIIYINIETGSVNKINLIGKETSKFIQVYTLNAYNDLGIMKIISCVTHELLTFYLDSGKVISKEKLPLNLGNIVNYIEDDNDIVVLNTNNEIIRYDGKNCTYITKLDNTSQGYMTMHKTQKSIWIMPYFSKDIYILKKNKIGRYGSIEIRHNFEKYIAKYFGKCTVNGYTFFSLGAVKSFLVIDDVNSQKKMLDVMWPDEKECVKELLYQKCECMNESEIGLDIFLKYIIEKNDIKENL